MIKRNINQEKFALLASGVIDGGDFNKKIARIRVELKIPIGGLKNNEESKAWYDRYLEETDSVIDSKEWNNKIEKLDRKDPNFKEMLRKIYREAPLYKMWQEVDNIIRENPDLNKNFRDAIYSYILHDKKALIGISKFQVFKRTENGKEVYGMEFYERLSKKDFIDAVKTMELFNKRIPKISPSKDIDTDIKILELSKKKGTKISSSSSSYLGFSEDSKFSDKDIILEIIPEEKDTIENIEKNKALIRQKRLRTNKKLQQLFPKTYKK